MIGSIIFKTNFAIGRDVLEIVSQFGREIVRFHQNLGTIESKICFNVNIFEWPFKILRAQSGFANS